MSTPEAAEGPSEPVDEVFYHDGSWYMAKAPQFVLPPFDFTPSPGEIFGNQMVRDMLWSMRIAPSPGPLCIITSVT